LAPATAFSQASPAGDPNDAGAVDATVSAEFQRLEQAIARRLTSTQPSQGDPGSFTTRTRGKLCAIAFIPGPQGSFNIRLGLIDGAGQGISHVIVDPFSALGERALLIESNFALAPPPGGTITDLYPDAAIPGGPSVVSFTGFDFLDIASWGMDPDTYDNPDFGATVAQMNNTRIEVVYDNGLRCSGVLLYNPLLGASIAVIVQNFP
jgi:hypothetical protein